MARGISWTGRARSTGSKGRNGPRHQRSRLLALAAVALAVIGLARGAIDVGPGGGTPGTARSFTLVGHNGLFARGMNAALAIYDHYVYIGSRSNGSNGHSHPGILIVDAADPSAPTIVGEIGPPGAGQPGITTRELRVWPQKKLLIVLAFSCSSSLHDCAAGGLSFAFEFYDLSDPLHPRLLSSHDLTLTQNLAFVAWHSGGLQAIDISRPDSPTQAGWFSPVPLPAVATEDPALSRGPNKVTVWSFPIIRKGLIYVIDIRNGLYVLRYTGPFASEVASVSSLEGNSNLGDARRIDQSDEPAPAS